MSQLEAESRESLRTESILLAAGRMLNDMAPRAAVRLCARQRVLAERLGRLNRDVRRTNDPLVQDFADQAVQRQNDEVIDRLRVVIEWELDQIDGALARIAAGDYGYCERCDGLITPARLEIMPQTALCEVCARSTGPQGNC
ncbi:MAG TPA: TraR/DksA family transcriptional regulator [Steroidobacteraceae bacterium]|nr:TraR/DksA family transcriptional regulator [Steroidobacteraceae bacterium]